MRIIAGELGGRRFDVARGSTARPTAERVREALFSILQQRVPGARVADLFAGTGALGLEALSRGAALVAFSDADSRVITHLGGLLERFGVARGRFRLMAADYRQALRAWAGEGLAFDIVFVDPPYRAGLYEDTLARLRDLMAPGGLVVVEHDRRNAFFPPPGWRETDRRAYGHTALVFLTEEDT